MTQIEHATGGGASTVTVAAIKVRGQLMLEVVAYAAVLRLVPWFRGGMTVTAVGSAYGGGQLSIVRAGMDGPYRLLARGTNRLDKLPPVQLRAPALPWMLDEEHAPEPVPYQSGDVLLRLTMPAWAQRPRIPRELVA